MSDQNIRKLSIPKLTYSKYCSKCKFCVKAGWSPNEGVKYGMLNVYCCVNGGKFYDNKQATCPNGIGYEVPLGTEQTFNPEDWKPERFNKANQLIYDDPLDDDSDEREKSKPSKQRKF